MHRYTSIFVLVTSWDMQKGSQKWRRMMLYSRLAGLAQAKGGGGRSATANEVGGLT